MVSLHHNGLMGILADEMGLGKSLQTISFLSYLEHVRGIPPASSSSCPSRRFRTGSASSSTGCRTSTSSHSPVRRRSAGTSSPRASSRRTEVCITRYEICLIERGALKKFSFEYIDEAHSIKDVDSILSQIVRAFLSRGRLLITGTPLQNNLKALFVLLNFICPEIFVNYGNLDLFLNKDVGENVAEEEKSWRVVKALHKILRKFLLRRVKSDV
ncbi:hypothetical protein D9611_006955 [Ephemerocybe angulata]|uniref:Helicase ATP-binding domain-containing protein n=1 Tax=Ephemerocybe angulata TaxID=980116 RepID=A0A8H5EVJ5_9AGAR|nr:hypothetical protein D9611_006955 [Tulosesus angulatus]